jgi:PAS domain S-box-containing protein
MKTSACPIRILLIDDDQMLADTARLKLGIAGLRTTLDNARTLKSAINRLNKRRFDIVILNPYFGAIQGPTAYLAIRKQAANVPILLIIPIQHEASALQLLDLGAEDYVIKEATRPTLLWHTARSIIQRCILRERLRILETVATQSNDAVLIGEVKDNAPLQSQVLYKNPSFDRLNRIKPQNLRDLAGYLEATVGKSSLDAQEIVQAMTSGKPLTKRIQNKRTDGSEFWTELKVVTLENAEKALKHFVLIHKDISEEKSKQICLDKLSLLEKQQTFAAALAHDFKAPVVGAMFAIELLKDERRGPLTAQQSEVIEQLQGSNKQLARLATNMLEMYESQERSINPSPEPFNLSDLIKESALNFASLAKANGVKIVCDVSLKYEEYYADQDAVKLVIGNLLDNAVTFSPRGGVVSLIAKSIGKEIVIRVIDQGPLLSQDEQINIFDSVWPREESRRYTAATALGLYVCSKVVSAYGGTIRCVSSSVDETVWEVVLPLVQRFNQ